MQRNKLIAVGAGLFGYGVFIGWSVTADLLNKKHKEHTETLLDLVEFQSRVIEEKQALLESIPLTDEELEQIQSDNRQMQAEDAAVGTTPEGTVAYSDADETVEIENSPAVPPGETIQETRAKLLEKIDPYMPDDSTAHEFDRVVRLNDIADQTPPFIIPESDYQIEDVDGEKYEKIAVTYYPNERVLVYEEDESEVEDINAVIGWENLNSWGDRSGDPNVVFVRNHRIRADYEVIRDEENRPPAHVIYGMDKEQFAVEKAANTLRFRPEDM